MSYYRRHAIIVTGCADDTAMQEAYDKACSIFDWVSPMCPLRTNTEVSFFIPPDGGKEGMSTSDRGDRDRSLYRSWLRAYAAGSLKWVEVQFGCDEPHTCIVDCDDRE